MPESRPPAPPRGDPFALQSLALRYAAGELPPPETALFEKQLAADQDARDALGEAVRLSAAALGQAPPSPDRSFRGLIRERLRPLGAWRPRWLSRRAYRGHPIAWAILGAGVVAGATLTGLQLAATDSPPAVASISPPPAPAAPLPQEPAEQLAPTPAVEGNLRAAEIWAELSTPDHVEKDHGDEFRLRQKLRDLHSLHPTKTAAEVRDH